VLAVGGLLTIPVPLGAPRTAAKVKRFTDKHIAHSQAKIHQPSPKQHPDVESTTPEDDTLSAKEGHEVIDVIGDLFKRYPG
jgi:hypothetical protein